MQTFLPYADFRETARILDRQRLGKQRVEVVQIVHAIVNGPDAGWYGHPATQMWKNNAAALVAYQIAICHEWTIVRGYRDSCLAKTITFALDGGLITEIVDKPSMPWWMGMFNVHQSHRSNLLRKDPGHYGRYFPTTPDDLPYVWPSPGAGQFTNF